MRTGNLDWLDKNEYPFTSNYFTVNGVRQHYIDEGSGETVVLVHGTPSWSFDFRKMIKELSKQYRCVAMDHIGFGLSDKPKSYDYSTQNHSNTLAAFIDHLQLRDISLVMHDFGGPVGFDYAIKNPGNIKGLVVLNSWLWNSSNEPGFEKLSQLLKNPLLPVMYRYLNFSARYLLPASFGEHKLPAKILSQYIKPFSKISERNGPLAFARSLINDQQWFGELWKQKTVLQKKPVLFVWGMKDKMITGSHLDKFASGFSNTFIKKLDSCGHFPQEECAEEVTRSIKYFLAINNEPGRQQILPLQQGKL